MAWVCEYPDHDGDRVVTYAQDRYIATIDIVSVDGNHRMVRQAGGGVKGGVRVCKPCAHLWKDRLTQGNYVLDAGQTEMFGG